LVFDDIDKGIKTAPMDRTILSPIVKPPELSKPVEKEIYNPYVEINKQIIQIKNKKIFFCFLIVKINLTKTPKAIASFTETLRGPIRTELTSIGILNLNQVKFSTVSILLITNNEDLNTITGISNKNI
jgi:hypothetical protein